MKNTPVNPMDNKTDALVEALGRITPPERSDNDWLRLENRLMADLACLNRSPARPVVFQLPFIRFKTVLAAAALLLIIAAALFTTRTRATEPSGPATLAARIIRMQGEPLVQSGTLSWRPLSAAAPLSTPARIRAGGVGEVAAEIGSGTGFLLQENGEVRVSVLKPDSVILELDNGSVIVKVAKRKKNQAFAVITPNAVCEVVGTQFKVEFKPMAGAPHGATLLTVLEGRVRFYRKDDPSYAFIVRPGEASIITDERAEPPAPSARVLEISRDIGRLDLAEPGVPAPSRKMVRIESSPSGAEITLNGHIEGQTPLLIEKPVADYDISLSLPGYAPVHRQVSLARDPSPAVGAVLEKIKVLRMMKGLMEQENALPDPLEAAALSLSAEPETIMNTPEFRIAVAKLSAGETRTALSLFDALLFAPSLSTSDRSLLLENRAACCRSLGDWNGCASSLSQLLALTASTVRQDNLLWEIITIRVSYLGEYIEAQRDLRTYAARHPDGLWIQEATLKLAEVEQLLSAPDSAAAAYERIIHRFPGNPSIDKALYSLAYLKSHDLDNCAAALPLYERLEAEHPASAYIEDALFWHADCLARLGKTDAAKGGYQKYLSQYPEGRWKDATLEQLESLAAK